MSTARHRGWFSNVEGPGMGDGNWGPGLVGGPTLRASFKAALGLGRTAPQLPQLTRGDLQPTRGHGIRGCGG
jgi:hypothetical protein